MGIFVTTCYTVLIVMCNIEAKSQSNLLPPGFDVNSLTTQEIQDREYGSKIVVVVEQMQIAVIWACKATLLILYDRLTHMVQSKENALIKLLAVYVALGFVAMEILYFAAWCRPFSQYWAVPTKSSQCNALINHRITNAVFNISSDIIMLCIALPMFIRSLLPLKRKLILCCIFSLGIFVILAAVLNKYYSFTRAYEPTWIFWYCRESSTAILVANLPFTWTLLRKLFNLGAFDANHPPPPTYHSSRTAGGRRTARAHTHHTSGGGGGSAEKHLPHSGSNHSASKESRSMSLIGSICAAKEGGKGDLSDNSQHSENGLLPQAVQRHDFAANVVDIDMQDIDLERGISPTSHPHPDHEHEHHHLAPRPISPVPSHRNTHKRLSADGTGGFYTPNQSHPTSPRRAHLAPRSRESSIASANRRPMSPSPSVGSHGAPSVTAPHAQAHHAAGAGGGRSARDRKMRARMSK